MDSGPASGEYRLCGGALPQVPLPPGGAAQLPEDGTKSGHQEGGMHVFILASNSSSFFFCNGVNQLCL